MHKVVLGVLALLASAAFVAVGAASIGEKGQSAKLMLVKKQPLVLRGLGFKPTQRVVVTVVANGKTVVRRVRSSSTGAFIATFTQLAVDPCQFDARAIGGGRIAVYKASERMCPVGLDPLVP